MAKLRMAHASRLGQFSGSEAEQHQNRNIGNLWDNFVEVTKLHDVVERMKVLVREEDEPMLILSDFFKGTEFRSIATCLRQSPDYVDVRRENICFLL